MKPSNLLTEALLRCVGPGHVLIAGPADAALGVELARRGCAVHQCAADVGSLAAAAGRTDTLLLAGEALCSLGEPAALLAEAHRCGVRFIALLADGGLPAHEARGQSAYWAEALLAAGYRRSPAAFAVADYEALNDPRLPPLSVYERIDVAVLADWPQRRLLVERDLHMDMSREFSGRADAHMVRYALAAQWVRPGDTVLDCACGLGYGTAILAARSAGARFFGVDIDRGAVAHARAAFGRDGVQFHATPGTRLDFLADASVDFIASFETIEHVEDYDRLIDEFARVLKPDGRIIASVPNLWVDETGRDPNPHHFHAFDYEAFAAALGRHFLIEARYRQDAPGGFKLTDAQRALARRPLDGEEPDTEWWIIVASANPLAGRKAAFRHPAFDASSSDKAVLARFGEHYANPWLYRPMVQMGERVADAALLRTLTLNALMTSAPDSADFGAAATVLGYQMLAQQQLQQVDDLLLLGSEYGALEADNPHVRRWQISLAYVCGQACLAAGRRAEARTWFDRVAALDALAFSPLLATKTVAAGFWRAMLRLVDGEHDEARAALQAAVDAALAALRAAGESAVGRSDRPLSFGFQELAEVADMASQCAAALRHLEDFAHAPGRFWSAVDTRRFGLASWCLHLERENEALQRQLRQQLAAAGTSAPSMAPAC